MTSLRVDVLRSGELGALPLLARRALPLKRAPTGLQRRGCPTLQFRLHRERAQPGQVAGDAVQLPLFRKAVRVQVAERRLTRRRAGLDEEPVRPRPHRQADLTGLIEGVAVGPLLRPPRPMNLRV